MKRCSQCAEKIQNKAKICRYCGAEQPKTESNKTLAVISIGVLLVLGIIQINSNDNQPSKDPALLAAEAAAKERNRELDRKAGKHCQGYRGEARNLSGLVKQKLRNPASFEHVSTTLSPAEDGVHAAVMKYRATNGFGAVDAYVAVGEVRKSDCSARVISYE